MDQESASAILPANIATFFAVLNVFLSITASLGNVVILVALHKVPSVYPPTKLLFRCLAISDLGVGIILQPLYVCYFLKAFKNTSKVDGALTFVLCAVSVFTVTTVSVDRLLALKLGLRYKGVVTLKRVRAVIFNFWLIGVFGGCVHMFWSPSIAFVGAVACVILCVIISVLSYTTIVVSLRKKHRRIFTHHAKQQRIPRLNLVRYKKTVSSMASIQLAIALCYFPYVVTVIMKIVKRWTGMSSEIAFSSAMTLVFSNSSLNPILYCWKIKNVRQAVKLMLKQLFCSKLRNSSAVYLFQLRSKR